MSKTPMLKKTLVAVFAAFLFSTVLAGGAFAPVNTGIANVAHADDDKGKKEKKEKKEKKGKKDKKDKDGDDDKDKKGKKEEARTYEDAMKQAEAEHKRKIEAADKWFEKRKAQIAKQYGK